MASKIKGIFIALELDQGKLKKSVQDAVSTLEKEFKGAQRQIANSLTVDTKGLEKSISNVAKSISTITNAVSTKSGGEAFAGYIKESETFKNSLEKLAEQSGTTSERLQNIWSRAVQANEIKATVSAVNSLTKSLEISGEEAIDFARSFGVSGEALDKIIAKHHKAATSLSDVAKEITKLSGVELTPSQEQLIDAEEVARSRKLVDNVSRFANMLNLSTKETLELARTLKLTEAQTKGLVRQVEKIESSGGGFFTSLKNLMTGGNSMALLQSSLATLGVNVSTAGIVELGKSMADTVVKVESMNTAFASIYGSAGKTTSQLAIVRDITNELGLEFYSTATAAKGFFAAAESSSIRQNANEIFKAFSTASTALKMSQEETNGMFLAISQMLSKGKISAEEMRQQLAERLPGAVQILADSMGVSTKKLDKMFEAGEVGIENLIGFAEALQVKYEDAAKAASGSLMSELNRLKTAWTDFKAEFFSSDDIAEVVANLQEAVKFLLGNIDSVRQAVEILGYVLIGKFAGTALTSLKETATAFNNTAKQILETGKAATKTSANVQALVGALGGWTNVVSLGISAIVAAYSYFKEKSEGPKLALSEINALASQQKSIMEATAESVHKYAMSLDNLALSGEKAKLSKQLQDMEKLQNTALALGDEIANSAGTAMKGDSWLYGELLKGDTGMSSEAYARAKEIRGEFKEAGKALKNAYQRFVDAPGPLKEEELKNIETVTADVEKMFKTYGMVGTEIYEKTMIMHAAMASLLRESLNTQKTITIAQKNINSGGAPQTDEPAKEPAKVEFAISSNRLKKRYKTQQDYDAYALTEVFSSGELRKDGEAFKLTATQINEAIEHAAKNGKDLLTYFGETYNLSPEIVKEIKAISNEARNVVAAPSNKKLEEFRLKLDVVRERYKALADTSDMSVDTVEGKLAKISDWAIKSQEEIERTYEKYLKLNKVEAEEYKSKSLKLLDKEKLDKAEQALLEYVEKGKEAFAEFEAAKTGAHKIEILERDYNEALDGLQAYLDTMLEKYAENAEAQKLIIEDVAKYRAALEDKFEKDSLNASTDWKAGIQRGADKLINEASDYASQWEDITIKGFSGMADALTDFCTSADKSWKDLGEAFSDLAKSIVNDIIKMQMQAAVSNIAGGLFGTGGMFSFFADGGVVNSGLGSFTNGVYNTPTFFTTNGGGFQRYANGGVFGEAGPEAIMPLTRMPNGRLGVASTGGGSGGDVQINVYNSSNSKAEVRQSESSNGGKTIDVLIGDVVAKQMNTPGSKLNRTVSTYTGGQQAVTRR